MNALTAIILGIIVIGAPQKVVKASPPVTLKDEGKSVTIQLVVVTDGEKEEKLYTTGCSLHKGDEVKPPCETATSPTKFKWKPE